MPSNDPEEGALKAAPEDAVELAKRLPGQHSG
jgi:hypothetical protein